ncbi:MAG: hypothetical protein PHW32_04935, partial [Bacilli bacterium]|nr:hypothetical protein [Bacilli bacterium]MDD4283225.1 hypothetical protein [Bacilli bacterium]
MLKIKKRNILFFVSFFLVASFLFINEVNAASVDFAGNDNQLILINEKQIFEGEQINCEDFVYTEGEANAISNYNLVQELFSLIMLLGPVLLIVFGTLDFAKAVLSGDESALKKAGTNFGKRILALILL